MKAITLDVDDRLKYTIKINLSKDEKKEKSIEIIFEEDEKSFLKTT